MKDVLFFENLYSITINGGVISKPRFVGNRLIKSKIIKQFDNGSGYLQVNLTDVCGNRKKFYVHRLVWMAYNGSMPEGYEIDHINSIKCDNNVNNLQLLTRKDNMMKCYKDNPHIINNLKYQGNPEPSLTQL